MWSVTKATGMTSTAVWPSLASVSSWSGVLGVSHSAGPTLLWNATWNGRFSPRSSRRFITCCTVEWQRQQ